MRLRRDLARTKEHLQHVTAAAAPLLKPDPMTMWFDAQSAGNKAREQLIVYLYRGEFANARCEASVQNATLATMLGQLTVSNYRHMVPEERRGEYARKKLLQVDFIAGVVARCRNKDLIPVIQIAFGVAMIHRPGADLFLDYFSPNRVLPSANWLRTLVRDAVGLWPGPEYECISYVTAAILDNYEEHASYKASHTADTQGERLAMTNFLSVFLPLRTAIDPSSGVAFNFHRLWSSLNPIFKPGVRLERLLPLFNPASNLAIQANQIGRWRRMFAAMKGGTFLDRPAYSPPERHEIFQHRPIWDKEQAKYVDVQDEVEHVRKNKRHKKSYYLFLAFDGAGIQRLTSLMAFNPNKYLLKMPAVLPVMGEHPHTTGHFLHTGWRPYSVVVVPLMKEIGHTELKDDWDISAFNDYDFAAAILAGGVGDYFIHLEANGGPTLLSPSNFLRACSVSADLEWLSHMLHDWLFAYWEFRLSIEGDPIEGSATMDTIWAEMTPFMHTTVANKTNYAPMSVMRVFWSQSLQEPLARVFCANRTISETGQDGSNEGWDMAIEHRHHLMSNGIERPTREKIDRYCDESNFFAAVDRGVKKVLHANRRFAPAKKTKFDADRKALCELLIKKLGGDWATASQERPQSSAKLLAKARADAASARSACWYMDGPVRTAVRPWVEVAKVLASDAYEPWILGKLQEYAAPLLSAVRKPSRRPPAT